MSGSNNLSYSHWKPNLSLIGNNAAPPSATNYQNIMKLTGSGIPSGIIHQHHSPQLSEELLIPAHTTHSPHSMSRIIASPGSSTSMYSPGSSASSSAPPSIPRAHQHSVPMSIIQTPPAYVDQSHHLDVYSQIGMQRIGQMFKTNLMANNNNTNCNNKNTKTNRPNCDNAIKMEQSMNNIKQLVESAIGIDAKQQIMHILEKISLLQPPERLLLYLRMPSSTSETDPLRQPQNPLGTRSEINFTINWVRSHLEMDPNVSIPKQDVYDEYTAYCAREDVKPLSTADFGKVMKQIFPSIRPRRLGTRGNSRYCYAAMRKTTKLECPQLPSLGDTQLDSSSEPTVSTIDGNSNQTIGTAATWNVIRTWAESLLNIEFKHPNELAEHITTNYMSGSTGTISNNSRALLQKKLLQRKVKGRKKKSMSLSEQDIMSDSKKRRKKRLKKSFSQSNIEPNTESPGGISTTNEPNESNVPDEIMHIKQERMPITSQSGQGLKSTSQAAPINLTNEPGKIKSEVESLDYGTSLSDSMDMHDYSNTVCKIEIDTETSTDVEQTIYCKKVRRAQELKGLSISTPSPKMSQSSPESKSSLSPASMLMRPPLCEVPTDLSVSSSEVNNLNTGTTTDEADLPNPNLLPMPNKRSANNVMGRIKKLRFNKHASVAGMNETKVDDIATDIIIPRERVVSICNMDKDALDDYLLNEGGDSQEQEAELLQYFQTTSQEKSGQNTITDSIASSHTATATVTSNSASNPTTSVYPILDNYQLHENTNTNTNANTENETMITNGNTKSNSIPNLIPSMPSLIPSDQVPRKQDQINELRQYLQQNLHQTAHLPKTIEDRAVSSSSQHDTAGQFHDGWKRGTSNDSIDVTMHSASDSLTALSLPYQHTSHDHQTETTSIGSIPGTITDSKLMPSIGHTAVMGIIRGPTNQTEQSPNSRSKNFNFVPISPRPQSPRIVQPHIGTLQSNNHGIHNRNTFLSPRRSPAVRKIVNKDLLKSLQDPSISTFDTTFKNEISASAPVSPSMTPHHFQFNASLLAAYNSASGIATTRSNLTHPSLEHQTTDSITSICSAIERSQSVPLNSQSPAFNAPVSSTAYNSVCNSVAQTPVPSEYADFTEDNFLDMLTESSSDQRIKIEPNEMSNLIQNDCIRGHISRSVPSTPLPMHGFHMNPLHNFGNTTCVNTSMTSSGLPKTTIDNSKSVPSTPILIPTTSTPFRYSPDLHRDFLINGNTVDAIKHNRFYGATVSTSVNVTQSQIRAPEQHASVSTTQSSAQVLLTTTTQPLEELPNYSDVNDPIIEGSHLMNNI